MDETSKWLLHGEPRRLNIPLTGVVLAYFVRGYDEEHDIYRIYREDLPSAVLQRIESENPKGDRLAYLEITISKDALEDGLFDVKDARMGETNHE